MSHFSTISVSRQNVRVRCTPCESSQDQTYLLSPVVIFRWLINGNHQASSEMDSLLPVLMFKCFVKHIQGQQHSKYLPVDEIASPFWAGAHKVTFMCPRHADCVNFSKTSNNDVSSESKHDTTTPALYHFSS
jgi:hypothetical protein